MTSTSPVVTPWTRIRPDARRLAQTGCAMLALVLVLAGVFPWLALVPALFPYAAFARRTTKRLIGRSQRSSAGSEHGPRLILGLLPIALYTEVPSEHQVMGWVTTGLLAALPLAEPILAKVVRGRRLRCARLPGIDVHNEPLININVVSAVSLFVTLVTTVLAAASDITAVVVLLPAVAIMIFIIAGVDTLLRVKQSVHADNVLYDAVQAYEPRFMLYYGVGTGSEYQVSMWIHYLEQIGEPFIVVLRHVSTFAKIEQMTSAPVIVRTSMRQLDDVVVPSIQTAFYVNNGALNAHLVRYPQITHVQLLHGDSDKATSFNPITAMFDKIFVAGQAGIDRYANNGVDIPDHKFTIVGRPQVESVARQTAANIPVRSVLYAPTWEGHFADTNYSSVSVAPDMIRALLTRGQRIVFRPHPYSYRNPESKAAIDQIHDLLAADSAASGREHVWGAAAEQDLGVFDCFNTVDAMISDVSSVVPDFLYSGKPFALVAMSASGENFADEFPLARAGYVIQPDLANLESVLDELLIDDSKARARQDARVHYLGSFDAEHYADGFISAARNVVLGPAPVSPTTGTRVIEDGMSDDERAVGNADEVTLAADSAPSESD